MENKIFNIHIKAVLKLFYLLILYRKNIEINYIIKQWDKENTKNIKFIISLIE